MTAANAFRYTAHDVWLIVVALLGVTLLPTSYFAFQSWNAPSLGALALVQAFVICTNYQCVAHNFVHNEFFAVRRWNFAFSVLNTLAIGVPQSIFRQHHLNHHQYNNCPLAQDGSVGDRSSLYRYSNRADEPEPFWRFALLSPLRADILLYAVAARKRGHAARLAAESAASAMLAAGLLYWDWRYFAFYYVPLIYVGHVLTYAEGYFEHFKATPGDKMRNAASCYGRLYNMFWFNNGYHQEHHCFPQVHWTRIPEKRAEMLPEAERRVVPTAHWFNF